MDPYTAALPIVEEMPTWHPLVVHLPVVLIPLALLFAGIGLVYRDRAWQLATLLCAAGAVAGAVAASYWLHPHTGELPAAIAETLAEHETYADWTLWLSVGALLSAAAGWWRPAYLRVSSIATLVLLFGATVAVVLAGHHGSMLTYQQGVGARGAYLEAHE